MILKKMLISIIFVVILFFSYGQVFAANNSYLKDNPFLKIDLSGNLNIYIRQYFKNDNSISIEDVSCTYYAKYVDGSMILNKKSKGINKAGIHGNYYRWRAERDAGGKGFSINQNKLVEITVDVKATYNKTINNSKTNMKDDENGEYLSEHKNDSSHLTEYLYFEKPTIKDPNFLLKKGTEKIFEVTSPNELKMLNVEIIPLENSDAAKDSTNKKTVNDYFKVEVTGQNEITITTKRGEKINKTPKRGQGQHSAKESNYNKKPNHLYINNAYFQSWIGTDKDGKLNIAEGSTIRITATDKYGIQAKPLDIKYIHPYITDVSVLDQKLIFNVQTGKVGEQKGNEIKDVKIYRVKTKNLVELEKKGIYNNKEKSEDLKEIVIYEKSGEIAGQNWYASYYNNNDIETIKCGIPKDAFNNPDIENQTDLSQDGIYLIDTIVSFVEVDSDGNPMYKYVIYATDKYGIQKELKYEEKAVARWFNTADGLEQEAAEVVEAQVITKMK